VWRRDSPWLYTNGFKSVLEGGGKCGPRASWAVMICQAFGIPAIGVGQPGHACVAAKTAYPEMQPQPGSAWKVHQGAGWQVSNLDGTSGANFLAAVEERSHAAAFSQIEHLRWLASALASKAQAEAVMSVATKPRPQATPQQAAPQATPATASKADPKPASLPEAPFAVVPGILHVEAESFSKMSGIDVYDCFTGGKQVNFQKNMKESWLDYTVDVPATGTYGLEMRVALVNRDQVFDISAGADKLATISMPNTYGLWTTTQAVDIRLNKGTQTLRISAPFQRGVALRWFELKSKATHQ
jgi:hypothetical protein